MRPSISDSRCGRRDGGQVTPWVLVLTLACMLLAGLLLDGGLALAAHTRALDDAEGAARAGAQQLDLAAYREQGIVRLDPDAASAAARAYLTDAGAAGAVTATATEVSVRVRRAQPTQLLHLIGVRVIHAEAVATARPRHGVTEPAPEGASR